MRRKSTRMFSRTGGGVVSRIYWPQFYLICELLCLNTILQVCYFVCVCVYYHHTEIAHTHTLLWLGTRSCQNIFGQCDSGNRTCRSSILRSSFRSTYQAFVRESSDIKNLFGGTVSGLNLSESFCHFKQSWWHDEIFECRFGSRFMDTTVSIRGSSKADEKQRIRCHFTST